MMRKKVTSMFSDILNAFSEFQQELNLLSSNMRSRVFDRTFCPAVVKVVDGVSEVTVHFEDGSKSVVKFSDFGCSSLENAVLYALVMRTFGLVDPETSEVVCPGLKKSLKRVIETRVVREKPETAKPETEEKKDPIPDKMAASEFFKNNEEKDEKDEHGSQKTKKMSKIAEQLQKLGSSKFWNSEEYVRPKKPFSQFSQEEKRAYWRWQNKKRRKTA